jgi:hypothetical protein
MRASSRRPFCPSRQGRLIMDQFRRLWAITRLTFAVAARPREGAKQCQSFKLVNEAGEWPTNLQVSAERARPRRIVERRGRAERVAKPRRPRTEVPSHGNLT